jgi:hypothetical protein
MNVEIEMITKSFNAEIINGISISGKEGDRFTIPQNAWRILKETFPGKFKLYDPSENKVFSVPKNKMIVEEKKKSRWPTY